MTVDTYPPIHDIGFYLLVILVMEALAVYTWNYRKVLGAKPMVYCLVCKSFWLLFLVLATLDRTLSHKLLWISLEQMMQVALPFFWYLLITELSVGDQKIPRVMKYFIGGIVALLWLIILTNRWTGLYWRNVWLNGPTLTGTKGLLMNVAFISSYLLNAIAYLLTISWFVKTKGLRRRQALLFMFSPLLSWAGHIMNNIPGGSIFEPVPMGFLLSTLYLVWFFYRWRVLNILPHAQETVVQNMVDGLLIIDREDYVVYLNPATQGILGKTHAQVGGKFLELVETWPDLTQLNEDTGVASIEIMGKYPGGPRYFQVSMTPLKSYGKRFIGRVIIFKDITHQKQVRAQLLEQQKNLSILTERDRLGREIHDGQGQIWSYLQLELKTVRNMIDSAELVAASGEVDRLIGITKDLNTDVREAITGLKSASSAERNFTVTLQDYLKWYEKNYGIATRLILPEVPLAEIINGTREVQAFRIIQEALTNIRKHAEARHVEVTIAKLDEAAIIEIVDDGRGFNPVAISAEQKHYGLQIMKERAEEAGGQLLIQSNPGAGTVVNIRFNLGKKEPDYENTASG